VWDLLEGIVAGLFGVVFFAETYVAEEIEHEVVGPFREVLAFTPAFVVNLVTWEQLVPSINVTLHKRNSGLDGLVCKRKGEGFASASM
jgi:hypothetical protein